MNSEQILELEFCSENDFAQHKGTLTVIKETPYSKNVPKEPTPKVDAAPAGGQG